MQRKRRLVKQPQSFPKTRVAMDSINPTVPCQQEIAQPTDGDTEDVLQDAETGEIFGYRWTERAGRCCPQLGPPDSLFLLPAAASSGEEKEENLFGGDKRERASSMR